MRNPFGAFDFSGFGNYSLPASRSNQSQFDVSNWMKLLNGHPVFGASTDVVAKADPIEDYPMPSETINIVGERMPEEYDIPSETVNVVGQRMSGMDKLKSMLRGEFMGAGELNDYGIYGVDEAMKRQAIREGIGSAGALLTQAAFAPSWRQAGPAVANLLPQAIGGYRSSLEDQSQRAVFNKKLGMELEDADLKVKERALKLAEAQQDWDDDQGMRSSIGALADTMGQEYLSMLGAEDAGDLNKEQKALWLSFKTQLEIMKKVPRGENLVAALGTYQKLAGDLGLEETAARKIQIQLEELATKSGFVLPGGEPDVAGYTKNEQEERALDRRYKNAQINASNALAEQRGQADDASTGEINATAKMFLAEAEEKLDGIVFDPATNMYDFEKAPLATQTDLLTNGVLDQSKINRYKAQKEFASELAVLTLQARQRGMNVPTEVLLQWLINRKAGK